jgi:hypothetical protein
MRVRSATPVLCVDRIEPTRDFFKRVGFEVLFEVPEGDRLGFAMLARDDVHVMVETRGNANEGAGVQALTRESRHAVVFIQVDDLDGVIAALAGTKVLVARHMTFYKADEISYEEPAGHVITFARMET